MFDDQIFKEAFNAPFFQRTPSSFVRDAIPKEFMNTGFDRLFPLTSGHDNNFINQFRHEHRPIRETQSFRIPSSINDSDDESFFRPRNSSTSSNGIIRNIPIRFADDQNERMYEGQQFNDHHSHNDFMHYNSNNNFQQKNDNNNRRDDFRESNSQPRVIFESNSYSVPQPGIRRTKSSGQVSPPPFGRWNDFLEDESIQINDNKKDIKFNNVNKPLILPKPQYLQKPNFFSNNIDQDEKGNGRRNKVSFDKSVEKDTADEQEHNNNNNNNDSEMPVSENLYTPFIKKPFQKVEHDDSIDEAIRSLEMLEINPLKYTSFEGNGFDNNKHKNLQQLDNSSLDSPSSSGIVGDLSDEEKKRSSLPSKYQILSRPNDILAENYSRDSFYEDIPSTLHKPVTSKMAGLVEQPKIIVPMGNGNTLTIPLTSNNGIYTKSTQLPENQVNSLHFSNYNHPHPPSASSFLNVDKHLKNKRVLVDEMENNLSILKKCAQNILEISGSLKWRLISNLQNNISMIRDNVNKTMVSLNQIVILFNKINPQPGTDKEDEHNEIVEFLSDKIKLMSGIKNELEINNYNVNVYARKNSFGTSNDCLDQYVILLKNLPSDILKIIEWIGILPTDGSIMYPGDEFVNNTLGKKNNSFIPDISSTKKDFQNSNNNDIYKNPAKLLYNHTNLRERTPLKSNETNNNNNNNPKTIIEEEDLESVISDTNSLHNDYAILTNNNPPEANNKLNLTQNDDEIISSIKSLSQRDKQLLTEYAPLFDTHVKQLSSAIETFLTVIENNLPPMEFVQQGKIIILEAHKLVYIGDTISKNLNNLVLKNTLQKMADKLCDILKVCVQYMKIAADEYPSLQPISDMVDQVVAVSNSSCDMKILINSCL
uniref:CAS_C domain-containing protein n=1 Tax=Strongyloides papillosus TaxID=174720 RepID=A0A0N5BRC7_STREA